MLNALPVVGWLLSLIFSVSLAVPFWITWTICGIGEEYFYFLPTVYLKVGFWNTVGIFMVVSIIKFVFIPKIASIYNDSSSK